MTEPTGPGAEPEDAPDLDESHDDAGLELARAIARGLAGHTKPARTSRNRPAAAPRTRVDPSFSGTHPDDRDPQTLDRTLGRFIAEHGWETELRVHGVFSRWSAIVGDEVAEHVRPESFADGRLVVGTESTAWATQMRLLAADLLRRLNDVLGEGTVEIIDVHGPHAPSWSRGRLRVKGRGPRDTYG